MDVLVLVSMIVKDAFAVVDDGEQSHVRRRKVEGDETLRAGAGFHVRCRSSEVEKITMG